MATFTDTNWARPQGAATQRVLWSSAGLAGMAGSYSQKGEQRAPLKTGSGNIQEAFQGIAQNKWEELQKGWESPKSASAPEKREFV